MSIGDTRHAPKARPLPFHYKLFSQNRSLRNIEKKKRLSVCSIRITRKKKKFLTTRKTIRIERVDTYKFLEG